MKTNVVEQYEVPVASTDFLNDAGFCNDTITYEYQHERQPHKSGIRFSGVAATRSRAERCCKVWHIENAYDTLVEVIESPWVDEIRADTKVEWRDRWRMRHFMIYLDSIGCIELIADSWEVLPPTPGTWHQ